MNNERGNVTIIVFFAMVFILAMAAMVIDFGYILYEKQRLSDAVDAAALAGAQDLVNGNTVATTTANQYALSNDLANPKIIINEAHTEITVKGEKKVPYYFARALGFNEKTITATAKAIRKPISGGTGFAPLGVVKQNFKYGELYSLKVGAGDEYSGNFGALALGKSGSSVYEENIKHGYDGELTIGMSVETETGNMSGPTQKAIEYLLSKDAGDYLCSSYSTAKRNCSRILYLPVIDSLLVNGRSEVTIVGFASFYVENVYGNGTESIIDGRFLKTVFPGDWNDSNGNDFGLYAIKLVY